MTKEKYKELITINREELKKFTEEYTLKRTLNVEEKIRLVNSYVEANGKYKKGDKVFLKYYNKYTPIIITGYRVGYNDNIEYTATKQKKDGTPSQIKAYYGLNIKEGDIKKDNKAV